MISAPHSRVTGYQEDSDEWLIDAARRAGHQIPRRERPAGTSAWRMLLSAGIEDDEILRVACAASGTEPADFTQISPALSALLPHDVATRYRVVPLGVHRGVLAIATFNPLSAPLERELAFASKQRVALKAASPAAILRAQAVIYDAAYGPGPTFGAEPAGLATPQRPAAAQSRVGHVARLSLGVPVEPEPGTALPPIVERFISTAVEECASEAQLEPTNDGGLVARFRIDGKLNDRFRVSAAHAAALVQALKVIARIAASPTGGAQTGSATYSAKVGPVGLRISTEPLAEGRERLVVRLRSARSVLDVGGLGLSVAELDALDGLLQTRDGLIVVAGPPGSGKTTTLYAMARALHAAGRRVATVEEPIEYQLDGVEQLQVSDSLHLTFAAAARATLNAGADAVLVGHLADVATTQSVVADGSAGRLVLTALDAADLVSAVRQLLERDADAAVLSRMLNGIVMQRLVRRLCDSCATPLDVSSLPEPQQRLLFGLPTAKLRRAVGCAQCRSTGYNGRTAVAHVVTITPEVKAAIARRADGSELDRVARECGTTPLWDAAVQYVVEGVTTLGELLDTLPAPTEDAGGAAAQDDIDALLNQLFASSETPPPATAPAPVVPPAPVIAEPAALRVLLVDDNADARRALAEDLKRAGITVIEAADGVAGLTYAQRLRPDVVLTEVALPRLDVAGLLDALVGADSRTTVIVYTSQEDEALHQWLRQAGAADVVSRSVGAKELVQRIRRCCAR